MRAICPFHLSSFMPFLSLKYIISLISPDHIHMSTPCWYTYTRAEIKKSPFADEQNYGRKCLKERREEGKLISGIYGNEYIKINSRSVSPEHEVPRNSLPAENARILDTTRQKQRSRARGGRQDKKRQKGEQDIYYMCVQIRCCLSQIKSPVTTSPHVANWWSWNSTFENVLHSCSFDSPYRKW